VLWLAAAWSIDSMLLVHRRRALAALAAGGVGFTSHGAAWSQASVKGTVLGPQKGYIWPAWDTFRKQFVSADGRVVDASSPRSLTVSEGQAYALFFALLANDRSSFELILRWTEENLCAGDMTARLPAWQWGRGDDNTWGVLDPNSASDADLWLAYTLGEAGRLWANKRYHALSTLLAARILREEAVDLPGLGLCVLPGPKGFVLSPTAWRLNPSYFPLQIMQWFVATQPDAAWKAIYASSLKIILAAAPMGVVSDWIIYDVQQGFQIDRQGPEKGQGAYNAIRVYLWAGMLHPKAFAYQKLIKTLAPMAQYVREKGYPPESIDVLTMQSSREGSTGFSAALVPFLRSLGDKSALQMQLHRLEARPVKSDLYYENALKLFGMGWHDGQYRFSPEGYLLPRWRGL
jgi:endoglucanase